MITLKKKKIKKKIKNKKLDEIKKEIEKENKKKEEDDDHPKIEDTKEDFHRSKTTKINIL